MARYRSHPQRARSRTGDRLAKKHRNVVRVLGGNEVLLRGDLTLADLQAHLDHVCAATRQPVSTAEPWHVWILYPELAEHVDYIAVHMLRFFHVKRLAGFKACALNFALRHTDPRAEIVAVIDADYVVRGASPRTRSWVCGSSRRGTTRPTSRRATAVG